MACSLIKKGLLGATLGAGALYFAFGPSAPSYIRTAFHRVRDNAKHQVPVQFEIDRARDEINSLEPTIKDNIESLVRADVEVEHLDREIAHDPGQPRHREESPDDAPREPESAATTSSPATSPTPPTRSRPSSRPASTITSQVKELLKDKEETLKAKQKAVVAARQQLSQMAATKRALLTKLAGIEARLKMIQTTKESNEFNFDDNALARAKSTVTDLEKRLEIMARTAELEGKYSNTGIPISVEPGRDVLKEMDEKFGPAPPSRRATRASKSSGTATHRAPPVRRPECRRAGEGRLIHQSEGRGMQFQIQISGSESGQFEILMKFPNPSANQGSGRVGTAHLPKELIGWWAVPTPGTVLHRPSDSEADFPRSVRHRRVKSEIPVIRTEFESTANRTRRESGFPHGHIGR